MKIRCIAGAVYFCAAGLLSATSLDDKIKAFEEALQKTAEVKLDGSPGIWPRNRDVTVADLNMVIQRGNNDGEISAIVSRLMATHPSDTVQKAGGAIIEELQVERADRAKVFASRAEATLSEAADAITHAKTAGDLDGIVKSLKALQNPEGGVPQDAGQDVANRIASTYQFATQWQNYLAAAANANWPEAQNSLRSIVENPRIDAPEFFPRSEILARYEAAFHGGAPINATATPTAATSDPDPILHKIQKPEDLEICLPQLEQTSTVPGYQPWDWSEFIALARARDNALAGLPFTIDFQKAVNGPEYGDDWSRITAMELLYLLPYYFDTEVSAPPKEGESLAAYLDRIVAQANGDGNLALVQRVTAVQASLTGSANETNPTVSGTSQFLAGLSHDAAGQYDLAVNSYEHALQEADSSLQIKVVGDRLAAIKKDHPDDFEKGWATFVTPPPPNTDSYGRSYGSPNMQNPAFGNRPWIVSVLPIPGTISIPAKTTPPATNSAPAAPPAETK